MSETNFDHCIIEHDGERQITLTNNNGYLWITIHMGTTTITKRLPIADAAVVSEWLSYVEHYNSTTYKGDAP